MNGALRRSIGIGLTALLLFAAPASAQRALLSQEAVGAADVPGGSIDGACGVAVSGADIYVSSYYAHAVDVFSTAGGYQSQVAAGDPPEGPCGLAVDAAGNLYANLWHQGVQRLTPSDLVLDRAGSTGVAIDPGSGDVYVDDRSYVAVYEPSGAPVEAGGAPLRIGVGSLEDAYGIAVFDGRVYVPDAGSDTVKVFEPAGDPAVPVATIAAGFVSLVDAAVAVDPTDGHLIVADDSQPGLERPAAGLYEFDGSGAYLGRLACGPVDGGPSGLAFDPAGDLYVTSGNGEGSNVFKYGPYTAGAPSMPPCGAVARVDGRPHALRAATGVGAVDAPVAFPAAPAAPAATASTVTQRRGLRVAFDGDVAPHRLPRHGVAGVRMSLAVEIAATEGSALPSLRGFSVEFNRAGRIHPGVLPACPLDQVQPATTTAARAACRRSLVGEGRFAAAVRLPQQSPFPSRGKVLAFNGRYHGRPAILAHVYGSSPIPTSYTLPLVLVREQGTYGTALHASLPAVTGDAAAVTALRLTLGRSSSRGRPYITAGCPAPAGFPGAVFPLARGSFSFARGVDLSATVSRNCEAGG